MLGEGTEKYVWVATQEIRKILQEGRLGVEPDPISKIPRSSRGREWAEANTQVGKGIAKATSSFVSVGKL